MPGSKSVSSCLRRAAMEPVGINVLHAINKETPRWRSFDRSEGRVLMVVAMLMMLAALSTIVSVGFPRTRNATTRCRVLWWRIISAAVLIITAIVFLKAMHVAIPSK